ncbi:MAG: type II toxin-antitoxin system VapC family toxin [Actinobacteria bacterium]|nr:type II toxin-antitoxin system VapC family toxin [Actinomycetota bacterium]
MSAHYLLDTCILSEPVLRDPNPAVVARILDRQGEIATAAPVIHELWFGCIRMPPSRKRDLLKDYLESLSTVPVLPYDARAARRHAEERARLESMGQTAPFVDGQIAAIAHVNQLVLITHNVDDFVRFSGLRVEDWFVPPLAP